MTKADQIRSVADLPTRVIAKVTGADPRYVSSVKAMMKRPEYYRARQRERDARRRTGPDARQRFWMEHDQTLIKMIKAGRLTREIAETVGTTKNAVIGRWNRLKEAGLA